MTDARCEQRLNRLSEQIAEGEQLIAKQIEIVSGLERSGYAADHAKFLLAGLWLLQAPKVDCRNKLVSQCTKNPA
jgi:hypothetical protein